MFSNFAKLQRLNLPSNPRVVIVGVGFAGIEAAKVLSIDHQSTDSTVN